MCVPESMCLHYIHAGAPDSQKSSEPLQLELQMLVSHYVCAVN